MVFNQSAPPVGGWRTKIKYPKLLFLLLSILAAYFFFQTNFVKEFMGVFKGEGYILIFIAGFLFTYGFTAPFAVGFFISLAPQVNIFLAAPLAGIGAAFADYFIFRFIRFYFIDEFKELKLSFMFRNVSRLFDHHFGNRVKKYFLWVVAGLLIASPLPDEIGVSLLSGLTNINQKIFFVISFCLNTFGILFILALAP